MDEIVHTEVESIIEELQDARDEAHVAGREVVRLVVIMRGVYGTGKTTFARLLQVYGEAMGMTVRVCSTSDTHDTPAGYRFDRTRVVEAVNDCFTWFIGALDAEHDVIVIDNNNTAVDEFEDYIAMAISRNYSVQFATFQCGVNDVERYNARSRKRVSPGDARLSYDAFVASEPIVQARWPRLVNRHVLPRASRFEDIHIFRFGLRP